jgi:hypothetical protein
MYCAKVTFGSCYGRVSWKCYLVSPNTATLHGLYGGELSTDSEYFDMHELQLAHGSSQMRQLRSSRQAVNRARYVCRDVIYHVDDQLLTAFAPAAVLF